MNNLSQKFVQIALIVRFFVIIGFLLSSFSLLIVYTYQIFSPIKTIIFTPAINIKQEQQVLAKLQLTKRSIASFYSQKEQLVPLDLFKVKLDLLPPSTIRVHLLQREYLAYFIANDKQFVISKELFFSAREQVDSAKLPRFVFLTEDLKELESNFLKSIEVKNLLALLEWINKNNHFLKGKISAIYLQDKLNMILIFSSQSLPIFLGHDNFETKMEKLSLVFTKLGKDFFLLNKIDLRYEDKIILESKP